MYHSTPDELTTRGNKRARFDNIELRLTVLLWLQPVMQLLRVVLISYWRSETRPAPASQAHATQMGHWRKIRLVDVEGFIVVAIIHHICCILPPALAREHSPGSQPLLSLHIMAAGQSA